MYAFGMMALLGLAVLVVAKIGNRYLRQISGAWAFVLVALEVRGEAGGPPYLVRWSNGHDSSFYPAAGTVAEHMPLPASGAGPDTLARAQAETWLRHLRGRRWCPVEIASGTCTGARRSAGAG